ncbi:hypothetical protein [Burkholderia gladioli]|uniref:hypothetical protein n=1 Tax=Burkholderia gladioli TaxID=28095 RepID=UPI00164177AD|nr:hypothetical protein [Burkholderia gladioli]
MTFLLPKPGIALALIVFEAACLAAEPGFARSSESHAAATHARCELRLSRPHLDYPRRAAGELVPIAPGIVTFGTQAGSLSAVCAQPARLALRLHGQAGPAGLAGFGKDGALRVRLGDLSLDGKPAWLESDAAPGTIANEVAWLPGQTLTVRMPDGVIPGRSLSGRLSIEPVMPLAGTVAIDEILSRAQLVIELLGDSP